MKTALVMTVVAADRTGIVETIARHVAEHGGNWLESRMCRLGGQFAGILRVEVPTEAKEALRSALTQLARDGLTIHTHLDQLEILKDSRARVNLEVVGNDRPGIVRQISRALASMGANVEDFSSDCSSAPMSGEILFTARARVALPSKVSVADLQAELEQLGNELMVTLSPDTPGGGAARNR